MTKIYKGPNSIFEIKGILELERPSSILLIRGNRSYELSGAKGVVEPQLLGYNITHLSGFCKSPSVEDIKKTIGVIKEKKIDFIIAVGGGTVMDIAKAASVLYNEEGPIVDCITGKLKPSSINIKKLFIPTTAGTGAEVTPFAVVYIGKTKYSLGHPSMLANYVILAPELTYHLNPRITAQTGCDALAQAVEGFWSINATDESKKYSREAISLILKNLSKAVNNPDPKSRKAMLLGAHLAGKSIAIAKTTAAHALSYPLTSYHGIPHGRAVMLTLPYFFLVNEKANSENIQEHLNLEEVKETFRELLSLLHVKTGEEAKDKLLDLMNQIHLETRLRDFGIKEKDLFNIIDNGFNPQRVKNNPVRITAKMELNILKKIL